MLILKFLLLGGVIGTLSGALGIGGGVLLVPALMWICNFDYLRATGTSVGVLALPVGLLGALEAYSQNRVDLGAAICIAVTFAAGAYGGALLVPHLPKPTLLFCFGLLMMFLSIRFILAADPASAHPTAIGLVTVAMAWLAYVGLRLLGRKYLPPPALGDHIRRAAEKLTDESEYYI